MYVHPHKDGFVPRASRWLTKNSSKRRDRADGSHPEDERPLHQRSVGLLDLRLQPGEAKLHFMPELRDVSAKRLNVRQLAHEIVRGFLPERLLELVNKMR